MDVGVTGGRSGELAQGDACGREPQGCVPANADAANGAAHQGGAATHGGGVDWFSTIQRVSWHDCSREPNNNAMQRITRT